MPAERWSRAADQAKRAVLKVARRPPARSEAQNIGERFRQHSEHYFRFLGTPGVELAWVKRAEDSDRLVLRLVEWSGRAATAVVTLRPIVRTAHTSNFLEDPGEPLPVTSHTVRLALRPFEIATVIVETR
jgi:alpha-mannosidase